MLLRAQIDKDKFPFPVTILCNDYSPYQWFLVNTEMRYRDFHTLYDPCRPKHMPLPFSLEKTTSSLIV